MAEYNGEIFEVQTLRPDQYEFQWVIPKYVNGETKLKYVVSKTRKLENGNYFRKHEFICGCMDWRNRRQKLDPPLDRCKHIRAVANRYASEFSDVSTQINDFGHVKKILNINEINIYDNYRPIIRFNSNWSGQNIMYTHILQVPKGALAININDINGNSFCGGYISKDTAYLSINDQNMDSFNEKQFFIKLSESQFTAKDSENYQAMQEQYERWAAKQMDVINQAFVFDGAFSEKDKTELELLKKSGMISDFEIVGSSLVLDMKNRAIIRNNQELWAGDYKVIIGKFVNFYAIGKNIKSGNRSAQNIHPHISTAGTPCLATYGQNIAKALSTRKWMVFAGIVSDFLTQYNPRSPFVKL